VSCVPGTASLSAQPPRAAGRVARGADAASDACGWLAVADVPLTWEVGDRRRCTASCLPRIMHVRGGKKVRHATSHGALRSSPRQTAHMVVLADGRRRQRRAARAGVRRPVVGSGPHARDVTRRQNPGKQSRNSDEWLASGRPGGSWWGTTGGRCRCLPA
jgi:hypothetical protein